VKKSLRERFQENVGTFMYGRNGMDQLSQFLLYLFLFFLIVSTILFSVLSRNTISATILQYAAIVLLVLSYSRAFSRNIVKRRNENLQYLKIVYSISNWFRSKRHRLEMLKNYKFFTCPDCKTTLRVPRGKGRINLTCPRCHAKFEGKS